MDEFLSELGMCIVITIIFAPIIAIFAFLAFNM